MTRFAITIFSTLAAVMLVSCGDNRFSRAWKHNQASGSQVAQSTTTRHAAAAESRIIDATLPKFMSAINADGGRHEQMLYELGASILPDPPATVGPSDQAPLVAHLATARSSISQISTLLDRASASDADAQQTRQQASEALLAISKRPWIRSMRITSNRVTALRTLKQLKSVAAKIARIDPDEIAKAMNDMGHDLFGGEMSVAFDKVAVAGESPAYIHVINQGSSTGPVAGETTQMNSVAEVFTFVEDGSLYQIGCIYCMPIDKAERDELSAWINRIKKSMKSL